MSGAGRQICIIGAGAAGLTAAIAAAKQGASVTVLEQNDRPGRKLLATGNGKCNLTNLYLQADRYYTDSPLVLAKCLERFSVQDALSLFTELGLEIHDRDGWVYPVTDQAGSVLQLLLMEAEHLHIKIKTRECVREILHSPSEGSGASAWQIRTAGWTYSADAVIVACGSPASAVQGSSGSAAEFAAGLGVPAEPFLPALVPLKIKGRPPRKWTPCRVRGSVEVYAGGTFSQAGKNREESSCGQLIGRDTGELQLTENGISGIPVFQVSGAAVRAAAEGREVTAVISFLPDHSMEEAAMILKSRKERRPEYDLPKLLTGLLPDRVIPVITAACGADCPPEKAASVLTAFPVPVAGAASLQQAQICSGGVLLGELTERLESRKYRDLFFCGEAVNVSGPCGGYNLQWAWTGGRIAGEAAGDADAGCQKE